jgi:hypothetical protein
MINSQAYVHYQAFRFTSSSRVRLGLQCQAFLYGMQGDAAVCFPFSAGLSTFCVFCDVLNYCCFYHLCVLLQFHLCLSFLGVANLPRPTCSPAPTSSILVGCNGGRHCWGQGNRYHLGPGHCYFELFFIGILF